MNTGNLLIFALSLSSFFDPGQRKDALIQAAQAEQAPAATAAAAVTVSNSYVIGPSDVLTITVWKETTLSGTILVRPDGMVSLALLGDVQAAGLTPLQLSNEISSKLKKVHSGSECVGSGNPDPQQGCLPPRRSGEEGSCRNDAGHDVT